MNLILYFTGTGNCLHCGKIIKEKIDNTQLTRIDIYTDLKKLQENILKAEKIGIILPVYAGTLPYMATNILRKIKFSKDKYIYSIATCAGSELSIHYDIKKLIKKTSNRTIDNFFTLTYPSNFQTNMKPKDLGQVEETINKAEVDLEDIIEKIKMQEKAPLKNKRIISFLADLSLKIAVRKDRSQNFYVDERCIGCTICKKICPSKNITIIENKPNWSVNCEACMACIGACPTKAIQYKEKTKNWGRYLNPKIKTHELFIER